MVLGPGIAAASPFQGLGKPSVAPFGQPRQHLQLVFLPVVFQVFALPMGVDLLPGQRVQPLQIPEASVLWVDASVSAKGVVDVTARDTSKSTPGGRPNQEP